VDAHLIEVTGRLQRTQGTAVLVLHVVTARLTDRSGDLKHLSDNPLGNKLLSRADEVLHAVEEDQRARKSTGAPSSRAHHPRDVRVVPKSRDFH
jgi:error-prone DNA polymerase